MVFGFNKDKYRMNDIAKKIEDDFKRQENLRRTLGIFECLGIALCLILVVGDHFAKFLPTLIVLALFGIVLSKIISKAAVPGKTDSIACSRCGINLRPYFSALLLSAPSKKRKIIEVFASRVPEPVLVSSFKHCPNCGVPLGMTESVTPKS